LLVRREFFGVTDFFVVFNEPRRPWLDGDALKEKFHTLSSTHHPDVNAAPEINFSDLNAAYQILRDPVSCLRHFLQNENPGALVSSAQTPEQLAEMFLRVGRVRRNVTEFLNLEARAASPLIRAGLMESKLRLIDDLEKMIRFVQTAHDGLVDELRGMSADWERRREDAMPRLVPLYHTLAFLAKWLGQLREDRVRLQF
jgi:hypothetical protein